MFAGLQIPVIEIFPSAPVVLMERITIDRNGSDSNIAQADVAANGVVYKVFDSAGTQVGATVTTTGAATISDTLLTGTIWTIDATGYNFKVTVAGTYFTTANAEYTVRGQITLTNGSVIPFEGVVHTKGPIF